MPLLGDSPRLFAIGGRDYRMGRFLERCPDQEFCLFVLDPRKQDCRVLRRKSRKRLAASLGSSATAGDDEPQHCQRWPGSHARAPRSTDHGGVHHAARRSVPDRFGCQFPTAGTLITGHARDPPFVRSQHLDESLHGFRVKVSAGK